MNRVLFLAKKARKAVSEEGAFCKHVFFRNEKGRPVSKHREATQFCAQGAILKANGSSDYTDLAYDKACKDLLNELTQSLPSGFILVSDYNNHFTTRQGDIVGLFDQTIERLEGK